MNFLQLCKRTHERSGMSGSGPTSVENQSPTLTKLIGWVQDADIDIQSLKNEWQYLWARSTGALVQGQQSYSAFELSLTDPKDLSIVKVDNRTMLLVEWDDWVEHIEPLITSDSFSEGTPTTYTQDPLGNILFYPTPDSDYTTNISYYKKPVRMVLDADVSPIDDYYQDAIVQKALMYYATFESDMDLYQVSNIQYEEKLTILCNDQLPDLGF